MMKICSKFNYVGESLESLRPAEAKVRAAREAHQDADHQHKAQLMATQVLDQYLQLVISAGCSLAPM